MIQAKKERIVRCNKCDKILHGDFRNVVNYCEDCLKEIKTLQPKL